MTDTLDAALDRLLCDGPLRARFLAGEDVFDLDAEDRAALAAVDGAQLDAMAALVRERVWRATHRGGGTLAELFPETVAAWRRRHPGDDGCALLVERFVASPSFERHRSLPHAGVGWCLEAAFHDWCEREGVGDADAREREFLAAMARALAVCPDADFEVPAAFRRAPGGWCAVSSGAEPTLYAALRGRVVAGPVTALVAALLRGDDARAVAERYGVDVGPVVAELAAMGLL